MRIFLAVKASLQKGFTLTELLVVVALLGIIAAIGLPSYSGFVSEAKKSKAVSELNLIALAETNYKNANGDYYASSSSSCDGSIRNNSSIETNLFEGKSVLSDDFNFCVNVSNASSDTASSYTIYAHETKNTAKGFSLDGLSVLTKIGY